ncbi:MAG: hypothetical protein ACTHQ3_01345 [Motilibacteraceae bacterium]
MHFSVIEGEGYASLSDVDVVLLDYEPARQDGYAYRAVRVLVPLRAPGAGTAVEAPSAAYRSTLHVEWDQP